MRSLGLLGGTFDPIHYGHLAIAQDVQAALELDQVLFIPAAQQPLKPQGHCALPHDRLAMCQLAIVDNPGFAVCDVELKRSGPSYTIDTVQTLQVQQPDARFFFIIGSDALPQLQHWHRINELVRLCPFVVVGRPGYALDLRVTGLGAATDGWRCITGPALDIMASALRERVRRGAPLRYQLPPSVEAYINEHGLYRDCA